MNQLGELTNEQIAEQLARKMGWEYHEGGVPGSGKPPMWLKNPSDAYLSDGKTTNHKARWMPNANTWSPATRWDHIGIVITWIETVKKARLHIYRHDDIPRRLNVPFLEHLDYDTRFIVFSRYIINETPAETESRNVFIPFEHNLTPHPLSLAALAALEEP